MGWGSECGEGGQGGRSHLSLDRLRARSFYNGNYAVKTAVRRSRIKDLEVITIWCAIK